MKKRLEAELISIAHRVLKLKGKEDLAQLHVESQKLYETLSVLKFVEDNIHVIQPKIDVEDFEQKLELSLDKKSENEIVFDDFVPTIEPTFEPVFEEKKDEEKPTIVVEHLLGDEFKESIFEKIEVEKPIEKGEKKKSKLIEKETVTDIFSEKPTSGLNISLNDKIGFVQHLFDNNNEDYNRVLSQLSTIDSYDEAKDFIENMVKPDYNNWDGKEDFEERFMEILEKKFKH